MSLPSERRDSMRDVKRQGRVGDYWELVRETGIHEICYHPTEHDVIITVHEGEGNLVHLPKTIVPLGLRSSIQS
jgi:predicted RNA binding protein YcfA (HicA-like mRNA interferase family)